nr:ankyrin repeat domain-containing protein [Endozoicomonas sp.]
MNLIINSNSGRLNLTANNQNLPPSPNDSCIVTPKPVTMHHPADIKPSDRIPLNHRSVDLAPSPNIKPLSELESMNDDSFVSYIIQLIDSNDHEALRNISAYLFKAGTKKRCYYQEVPNERLDSTTLLLYAIKKEHPECVSALINKNPELLKIHDRKQYPIHAAAKQGNLTYLKLIVTVAPSGILLNDPDSSDTALHHAVKNGQLNCIRYIIEQEPEALKQHNKYSQLPASYIMESENREEVLRFFINNYHDILEDEFFSLLLKAVDRKKRACVILLLENFSPFQNHWLVYGFNYTNLTGQYPDLYKKHREPWALARQPIAGFDIKKSRDEYIRLNSTDSARKIKFSGLPGVHDGPIKNQNKSAQTTKGCTVSEHLNLFSVNRASDYLHQARSFLAGIDHAGVILTIKTYDTEDDNSVIMKNQFWSLGDECASVQIMNSLVDQGVQKITVKLTTPRKFTDNDHKVILSKLATLIPEIDGSNPQIPTKFERKGCHIEIVGEASQTTQEVKPALWFSFTSVDFTFRLTNESDLITIKPYRFNKCHEIVYTDIIYGSKTEAQGNVLPLSLPVHSIIPKSSCDSQKSNALCNLDAVNTMITMGEEKQAHISFVYGLHHPNASYCNILKNWLNAITEQYRTGYSPCNNRPLIIAVFPNTNQYLSRELHRLHDEYSVKLIDIHDGSAELTLSSLNPGEIVITEMPVLPKPVFERLVSCSDYPVLTEGANLTSYLLQTGHPYLAVLPCGDTPVPQDIGYAFEAIRAQALSYKLGHSETESEILCQLENLVLMEKYQEALDFIEKIRISNYRFSSAFGFFWSLSEVRMSPQADTPVTVVSLLTKARDLQQQGKTLGEAGRQALIHTLTPCKKALTTYINDCLNPGSPTIWHFELMKEHVNKPFNNAVAMACVKFAQHKGIRPPYSKLPDYEIAKKPEP